MAFAVAQGDTMRCRYIYGGTITTRCENDVMYEFVFDGVDSIYLRIVIVPMTQADVHFFRENTRLEMDFCSTWSWKFFGCVHGLEFN